MPPKIKALEKRLSKAGFQLVCGKGSHRKWVHPSGAVLIMSGKGGDDAKPYQVKETEKAIREVNTSTE